MKKHLALFSISALLATAFWIPLVFATDTPTLDPITSPVDATKALISGHANPGDKIIITGGSYQIPPFYADDTGYFELEVSLVQETVNIYSVKADDGTGASSQIQVVIEESTAAAAAAEAQGGGDRTAPAAPNVYAAPKTIDAGTYLFIGTAEADTTIKISGTKSGSTLVRSDGTWQIFMNLEQNATNNFTFTAKDTAGNVSPGVKVTINEESTTPTEETDETEETTTDDETTITVVALSDITGHWAENYIIDLVTSGAVSGYDDGTFRPDNAVTRAEFVKMVVNAFGYDVADSISESSFTDVETEAWFAPYIESANTSNIVDGYSDGTFGPGNTINRAEAMKILLSAANLETTEITEASFNDVDETAWFAPYVYTAYDMAIVSGYGNDQFGPGDNMTRAQVAKVIMELTAQL